MSTEATVVEGSDRRAWDAIRADFPILTREVNGHALVYLDTAASSQVPRRVLDAVVGYYERDHANVHRGVHELSRRATDAYEGARGEVAAFLGARAAEIVFTRGATEAINLVRYAWAGPQLGPGDVVVVSEMEHHSNLVPWQLACEESGARLAVCPIRENTDLDLDRLASILRSEPVRLVAVSHVSNTTGAINPVARVCEMAHDAGAAVLVDGCQAVPHLPVDLGALGADFYALSAHKMYGVTGAGALWIRPERAAEMRPFHGGGGMIERVSWEETTYADPPGFFEAGTPPIAQAVAMGEAARYLRGVGRARVAEREGRAHAIVDRGA